MTGQDVALLVVLVVGGPFAIVGVLAWLARRDGSGERARRLARAGEAQVRAAERLAAADAKFQAVDR